MSDKNMTPEEIQTLAIRVMNNSPLGRREDELLVLAHEVRSLGLFAKQETADAITLREQLLAAEAKCAALEKARPRLRVDGELAAAEWEDVQDQAASYSSDSIWRKVVAELRARRAADLSPERVEDRTETAIADFVEERLDMDRSSDAALYAIVEGIRAGLWKPPLALAATPKEP